MTRVALDNGIAAATLVSNATTATEDDQLRFAFDGDAVLFSDEAEQIYKRDGLDAFAANEYAARRQPLMGGPFKNFLASLQQLQQALPAEHPPIRTALVTGAPHRLMSGSSELCEPGTCASMNRYFWGLTKTEFLKAYRADVFFDDQQVHCNDAAGHVPTGHVPHGVANAD